MEGRNDRMNFQVFINFGQASYISVIDLHCMNTACCSRHLDKLSSEAHRDGTNFESIYLSCQNKAFVFVELL
jgi:hypothetical protein